jgi:hypothetical protein
LNGDGRATLSVSPVSELDADAVTVGVLRGSVRDPESILRENDLVALPVLPEDFVASALHVADESAGDAVSLSVPVTVNVADVDSALVATVPVWSSVRLAVRLTVRLTVLLKDSTTLREEEAVRVLVAVHVPVGDGWMDDDGELDGEGEPDGERDTVDVTDIDTEGNRRSVSLAGCVGEAVPSVRDPVPVWESVCESNIASSMKR